MTRENNKTVRLACILCDRKDGDEITPQQLEELVASGDWADIEEMQSYEEATRSAAPGDDSMLCWHTQHWYTHLGTCKKCHEKIMQRRRFTVDREH